MFIACTILCSAFIHAQNSVKGVVVSEDGKGKLQPIAYANVYWLNTNIGTTTNENGVFQLATSEDSRNLVVSFVGFTADTIYINDFDESLSVVLKQSITLGEVEISSNVTGTQFDFMNPMKMETLNEAELFKAACCNLSESFETNASVDVSFTDAVTGAKQIKMLGLDGPYTYITRENMPGVRGLGNAFGLSFIPGTWINSIQVTKGVGSVVNGYESIAGQINVELQKPRMGEQLFANLYLNQSGRMEANFVNTQKLNEKWGTTLLLHGSTRPFAIDENSDGFMDFPNQEQVNLMNRWGYHNRSKGIEGQFGINYVNDNRDGGQIDDQIGDNPKLMDIYEIGINTEKLEGFAKIGFVFPKFRYRSMGLQLSGLYHSQDSRFGRTVYDASQKSFYANYIYQSIIGNTNHQFKTGFSFLYDDYDEKVNKLDFQRTEEVPGLFFEYTFKPSESFTLVSGIRADYHNIFGTFVTPRLHLRWAPNDKTVIRALAGSGQRTANIFAENQSIFATSREIQLAGDMEDYPYGLMAEKAWNFGFNLTRDFTLNYRDGYVSFDIYRTQFINKAVMDIEEVDYVRFYNLDGESYSNSFQLEFSYEILKFVDFKTAYRFLDVKTDFLSGLKTKPFTPEHRMFANLSYSTSKNNKGTNWQFDATWQWYGEQRIPSTEDNPLKYTRRSVSPDFYSINAQVTRNFSSRLAIYVGVENLNNYTQLNPIIAPENPFGDYFDSGLIWGPIYGRMFYGGLRYRIQAK